MNKVVVGVFTIRASIAAATRSAIRPAPPGARFGRRVAALALALGTLLALPAVAHAADPWAGGYGVATPIEQKLTTIAHGMSSRVTAVYCNSPEQWAANEAADPTFNASSIYGYVPYSRLTGSATYMHLAPFTCGDIDRFAQAPQRETQKMCKTGERTEYRTETRTEYMTETHTAWRTEYRTERYRAWVKKRVRVAGKLVVKRVRVWKTRRVAHNVPRAEQVQVPYNVQVQGLTKYPPMRSARITTGRCSPSRWSPMRPSTLLGTSTRPSQTATRFRTPRLSPTRLVRPYRLRTRWGGLSPALCVAAGDTVLVGKLLRRWAARPTADGCWLACSALRPGCAAAHVDASERRRPDPEWIIQHEAVRAVGAAGDVRKVPHERLRDRCCGCRWACCQNRRVRRCCHAQYRPTERSEAAWPQKQPAGCLVLRHSIVRATRRVLRRLWDDRNVPRGCALSRQARTF